MNIIIAPDSFKETLEAKEVASTIEIGFKKVFPNANIEKIPLADGGEGTVKTLVESNNGELINTQVEDPLGRTISSYYGIINNGKTAIIEMATASGLELLKEEEKNPLETSTYGFGQLINHALKKGVKEFILGLGGSATNDAGVGMLQALGAKFYNKKNQEISKGAKEINQIASIDITNLENKFKDIIINVACDVTNPLCGQNGASFIFGKQKGADEKMIKQLDSYLLHFANLCEETFDKKTKNIEGTGAAGGLGFALVTFLNANLQSGIELIMQSVNLEEKIQKADLVITGEGKMDKQSIQGKTPIGVAKLAKKYDKKVIAITGCLDEGYEIVLEHGVDAVFDCTPISNNFETIKKNAKKNLELTSFNIAKCLKIS
ncbi:glycerate kinase [Arcobacter sp. LA11]|uniref:glycerate kinase n=1 Tax=Arcobacter sp. LA11 TaxID=1898176 RepID=UPI000933DEB4|nr:glycerate kinase [Arcobacter sp. LA11]